jgi:hypothetical protein
MEKKTVASQDGKKRPADTAKVGGAAYAPHEQDAEKLGEHGSEQRKSHENAGDERTPDKTIGEIKYAEKREN